MEGGGRRSTAKVVVLGDIGRSPRMQYHALSLANAGFDVCIIGYKESRLLEDIEAHTRVIVSPLYSLQLDKGPKLVRYFVKAVWQFLNLFFTLVISGNADYILCQNPPAIPTLPACWLYSVLTRTKFYIDWHNYAYTIMALNLKSGHPLLRFGKYIESVFGKKSDHSFCVTHAMQDDLAKNWGVRATVLYDHPPEIFRPISLEEKHIWFLKLKSIHPEFFNAENPMVHTDSSRTRFTEVINGEVKELDDRPGLLFSSTSWTPDEDFGILMNALEDYESAFNTKKTLPELICVITGKGPMKQHYIGLIESKDWKHVKILTPWLEFQDYPTMVASADLGVCLHTSSSGLDLPMKVVDMFGAGLPVCAVSYKCLGELIKNNINGYTFTNSEELSELIQKWFQLFPKNKEQQKICHQMKKELKKFQECHWDDNWTEKAREYFK